MSTDPKRRGKRQKKRKFYGNQYTKPSESSVSVTVSDTTVSQVSNNTSSVSSNICVSSTSATPTTTERKIGEHYKDFLDFEKELKKGNEAHFSDTDTDSVDDHLDDDLVSEFVPHGSRIIDVDLLGLNISNNLLCRFCKKPVKLIETDRQGLGSKLAFHCDTKKCSKQQSFPTCSLFHVNNLTNYSINRRSVFAMRSIGADRAELQTLCPKKRNSTDTL